MLSLILLKERVYEHRNHSCMDERIRRRGSGIYSGSLKEVAKQYQVTYPTVRLRLDRLIQKIQMGDEQECDPYISLIKRFALDGKIDRNTAQVLTREFKKRKEGSQT